jgi:hypothetical protein
MSTNRDAIKAGNRRVAAKSLMAGGLAAAIVWSSGGTAGADSPTPAPPPPPTSNIQRVPSPVAVPDVQLAPNCSLPAPIVLGDGFRRTGVDALLHSRHVA